MKAPAGVIVVFAKAPRPGSVKTRMTPPLSPDQAAGLYASLLADVLAATAGIARDQRLAPVLAVHPANCRAELAAAAPSPFSVVSQRGPDLSHRMAWAVREAAAAGASRILLRGSDSPVLDGETVGAARQALDRADLVVCPDRDGGYSLIGLREPTVGLFSHAMSTPSVLKDTLAKASTLGLRAQLLEPTFDLDTVADLELLGTARRGGAAALCPQTLAYLDEHDLWQLAPTP